jgi:hypothetical protein
VGIQALDGDADIWDLTEPLPPPGTEAPVTEWKCVLEARFGSREMMLPGTITDLSMTGCYIKTLLQLPAGCRIEISIPKQGFRIVLPARIRSVDVGSGMWVDFIEISRDYVERTRLLMAADFG